MHEIDELRLRIAAACPGTRQETPIPRLALLRADAPTSPGKIIYDPMVCFAVQGRKRLLLADRAYAYDSEQCLVISLDLPVIAAITEASAERPYLAVRLGLDPAALATLILEMPGAPGPPSGGIGIAPFGRDLADPLLRLVRLLDRPADAAVLAPLIEREILYRLLCGPQGPALRQIAVGDSRLAQVALATGWIRENFARPLRIADLARHVAMSTATLHRHFRAVTSMSPLQYHKQVRLQEARRLLLAQGGDAQRIGFTVGYGSPSQFSRDYARLFGAPPARDAARLRAGGEAETALAL